MSSCIRRLKSASRASLYVLQKNRYMSLQVSGCLTLNSRKRVRGTTESLSEKTYLNLLGFLLPRILNPRNCRYRDLNYVQFGISKYVILHRSRVRFLNIIWIMHPTIDDVLISLRHDCAQMSVRPLCWPNKSFPFFSVDF